MGQYIASPTVILEYKTDELSELVNETLSPIIADLLGLQLAYMGDGRGKDDVLVQMVERHLEGLRKHVDHLALECNKGLGLAPR